ncbi:MAG TPA: transglycosylase domain-containing protein [Patescibacteria group bacterium]|nr:transglycosylase domain-containing protein [Patescibacteria group bacterium]
MIILRAIFLLLLGFFTFVGDITIFLFTSLLRLIEWIAYQIARALHEIRNAFATFFHKLFRKKKKRKSKTLLMFYSPIVFKIKYFLLGIIFASFFIFIPVLGITLTHFLPDPSSLGQQPFPQTTKIYDRNHTLLYQFYATQNRTLVKLKDIPLPLQQATIAIEDKNFYQNPGFDIVAIIRAAIADLKHTGFQGGSTITQQLIKSSLLSSKVTLDRKLEEVLLAFWAERIYSKDKILEMYFNEVPYGGTAWGVEAAAQTYFGKDVKDLDLAQSAFLAGMPQAPSDYSPFGEHPTLWKNRQKDVLSRMEQLGYISAQQRKDAEAQQLTFETQSLPLLAPHFVMYIKDLLIQKYGLPLVEKGGLSVITSLDLPTQQMAQTSVSQEVAHDGYLNLTNGAALVTNPQNGDILAMVGSADYNNPDWGNVNIATSLRQPGSSIKIVTYAAALSKGYTAATMMDDSPVVYRNAWETYAPVNYDGRFHGFVPLRIALANSFNIPAVKTLNSIGIPAFVDMGHALGISHLQPADHYGLSVTLGAAEVSMIDMATAYGTLANSGSRIDVNPILKVTDSQGTILEEKSVTPIPVLSTGVSFVLSNILADNQARSLEFGPNSPLLISGHTVSVKTGTTDDKRDNWTDGYTKNRLVIVWVGNNDNTPMSQSLASGITGAAPIWHTIMANLVAKTPEPQMTTPDDIIAKPCLGRTEYFVKGTENSVNCVYIPPVSSTPSPTP